MGVSRNLTARQLAGQPDHINHARAPPADHDGSLAYAYTEPVREFARKRGISPTKVYDWIEQGLIESFLEGKRRHVVVSSYDRLVRRRITEQQGGTRKLPSSNPKVRQAAATANAEPAKPKRHRATPPPKKKKAGTARGG